MPDTTQTLPRPDASGPDRSARRGGWAIALVVIGSIVALLSTLNTWVERQALDTDAWVDVTDQLLADDDVRESLAVFLVDELYAAVSVEDALADALPSDFVELAPLLAGLVREPATAAVDSLLRTDAVRETWRELNRVAHETLVAVIEDDTGDVLSAAGGVVSIDLGALVKSLGERIGLGGDLLDELPEDAGVVVLFESDELEFVQDAAKAVTWLSAFLFLLVVALFAGAIYVSGDRRRTARDCGIGLIVVGVVYLVARGVGINALVDNLRRADDGEPGRSILLIGSSLLRQVALTHVLVGAALVLFAFLVGPGRGARALRAFFAPVLRHGTASALIGGMVVYGVLLWLKPGGPIDSWVLALGVAALCIVGVVGVQRAAMGEFPDMTFARFWSLAAASTRRGISSMTGSSSGDG